VQEGNGNGYTYEWHTGPTVTGPLFTMGKQVIPTPALPVGLGQYTVVALHPTLAFCPSIPSTTEVLDGRIYPSVEIEQKNPLTYCDPARPNGVAKATVNGEFLGYTFDWFVGDVSAGILFQDSTSEVSGLTAITYTVRATDDQSSCVTTKPITIENQPVRVPVPSVVILSHLTRCLPPPDGALQATVNDNTKDYTINWYDGRSVQSTSDNVGEFYRELEAGFYTATATDNESSCISNPVITEVLPFQEIPEFDITTLPTNCDLNIGVATFVPLNDVEVATIIWDIDGVTQEGTILSGLPKGKFSVTVTTSASCSASKDFEILPEILVYNGVSRNGDGANDSFQISCIQDFPNNNVRIFNRAGTLVYEANGYDNADVSFNGISNQGLSLLGRELPDGTYFFIITKGDGSRPATGYLELLR
jgi:large repetitive protein